MLGTDRSIDQHIICHLRQLLQENTDLVLAVFSHKLKCLFSPESDDS
jgi:hypothetical protein